jgi:phage shock protein A
MRFFDRLSLLVKSDAHGIIDGLEERSLLLKQHLREAELELTRKRARAEALEEEERRLGDEAERLEGQITSLDQDVELALEGDEEELARFAVRRLLPLREANDSVRARMAEIADSRARLAERLETQQREFEQLTSQVRARLAAAAEDRAAPRAASAVVMDEEVELELLRRRRTASAEEGC